MDEPQAVAAGADEQRLFDSFPPATYEAWRQAAEKTLKGVPFEKKLVTKTYEGISLQPIYNAADVAGLPHVDSLPGLPPFARQAQPAGYLARPWRFAQELPYPTPAGANAAARADLPRGLNALNLPLDLATRSGLDPDQAPAELLGQGLSLAHADDLTALLAGIDLDTTPLLVNAGAAGLPLAALLAAAADPARLTGCLGADPLGHLAATGALPTSLEQCYADMAALTVWAQQSAPQLRTILVDLQPYHNGGASAAQDLAYALATGVAYLRAMTERGLSIDAVAPRVQFTFAVGATFFLEIARLRAARALWARVVAAFGGSAESQKMAIHARTSAWTKTRTDAYNNMLRATSEAFAAVMGGCDSLHVSPFDEAVGLPDEFSRRIARNVQVILKEECSFGRLIDPAGGSWAVEKLTDEVAQGAWALFQAIEGQGGMAAALAAGLPQSQIAALRNERFSQVALRREVFIGSTMFANLKEQPLSARPADPAAVQAARGAEIAQKRAASAPAQGSKASDFSLLTSAALAGATLGQIAAARWADGGAGPTVAAIPAHRGAEQFEELRAAADAYAQRTGARPAVFLATMGPLAQHKGRADFATTFFEAGGFAVTAGPGYATAEEAAQAAIEAGAPIVVICSTDDSYPAIVPPLTGAIKAAQPDTTVVLAGYPADQVAAHKEAGVDEFIHLRADCYATLARLQQLKGVRP